MVGNGVDVSVGLGIQVSIDNLLHLGVGQITVVLGVTSDGEDAENIADIKEVVDGDVSLDEGLALADLDGPHFIDNNIKVEAPRQTGTAVATDDSRLRVGECSGVRTTRLGNSHEVDTEVLEELDFFLALLTSLLIGNDAGDDRAIILGTGTIAKVNISLELMATVVSNGVEHLKGGVTFLDKLGHSTRGQTSTFSILKGVVGVDTDVLGLTEVISQGDTLDGTEVLIVVAVVVGVGVSTGILDKLNQIAGLFVVGRSADGRVVVESLLETELIVGDTLRFQVGVVRGRNLRHEEIVHIVGSPTTGRTAGDNVVTGFELGFLTNGEGESDTGHSHNLGSVALESLGTDGTVGDGGKTAITKYYVKKRYGAYTLLEIELVTGRTHQIRAHMAAIHHPVVGDNKYGDFEDDRKWKKLTGLDSQFLHAADLYFGELKGVLKPLSGKHIHSDLPELYEKALAIMTR